MAKLSSVVITAEILDEDSTFDLLELCHASGIHAEFILDLIEHGVLEPKGEEPQDWIFDARAVKRSCVAIRLSRDFNLNTQAIALVLDLLDEIKFLRMMHAELKKDKSSW